MPIRSAFPLACLRHVALLIVLVVPLNAAAAFELNGVLQVANAPDALVANKRVRLFETTDEEPIERARAVTDDTGAFNLRVAGETTDSLFFLEADLSRRVHFVSVLGQALPAAATINEVTTIAASYAFAQFYRGGQISGDDFALHIAAMMYANLADPVTGAISDTLLTPPNAYETNSLRMLRSLSNLLNHCAISPAVAWSVLNLTREPGQRRPTNTAVAFANLARDPAHEARRLFNLSRFFEPFTPALNRTPNAWCVTVKVNDSGSAADLIGGPANVAFDSFGYAWIPNNVYQGSPDSGDFLIVLQPDGKPADGSHGSPVSPIRGGGIKGGGWGVDVGPDDLVWAANFGWGGNNDQDPPSEQNWPQQDPADGTGSVSLIRAEDGLVLSQPDGFYGGVWRAQAIEVAPDGDVWIASLQNDSVVVYRDGDPLTSKSLKFYNHAQPFGVVPLGDGSAWVSNSGGLAGKYQSSIAKVRFNLAGELEKTLLKPVGDTLRVIVLDSYGNLWLASNGDSKVYAFDASGEQLGAFDGGGINGPWGLAVDGEENVWVANFGEIRLADDYGPGRISKLWGANSAVRPHNKNLGDPISPASGYTVISGGDEVRLADGSPLYGENAPPSFTPMMRQTSLQIDAAGNIWTINNWKPSDFNNIVLQNPGGDGVIIFVGLAPPPRHPAPRMEPQLQPSR